MFLRCLAKYALWSIFFFYTSEAAHRCPMPLCKTCVPIEVHDAPGIGIDLSTSHGTAAIHFLNGSVVDAAQVSAQPEYFNLLQQLADTIDPPPLTKYQKWRRWLNRRLRKPSTPEIGILSRLIRDVYDTIRSHHPEINLDKVVVTAPMLPALRDNDFLEAVEYAGLHSWLESGFVLDRRFPEPRAHYAAEGKGLCKDFRNRYNCRDEEQKMPGQNVYYVQFTSQALYTAIDMFHSPFGYLVSTDGYLLDYKLGMNKLDRFCSPAAFWAHVRSHLFELPSISEYPITHLQLAGDSVTNEKFIEVLKEALSELSGPLNPKQSLISLSQLNASNILNPIFAAARGAATYAQRKQEAPWECLEPKWCEEERRRNREATDSVKIELK